MKKLFEDVLTEDDWAYIEKPTTERLTMIRRKKLWPQIPYEILINFFNQRKVISENEVIETIPGWVGSSTDLITLITKMRKLKNEIVRDTELKLKEKCLDNFRDREIGKNEFIEVLDSRIMTLYRESSLVMNIDYKNGDTERLKDDEIDLELNSIQRNTIESFSIEIKCDFRIIDPRFSTFTLIKIVVSETSNLVSITNTEDKKFIYLSKVQSMLKSNKPRFRFIRTMQFSLIATPLLFLSSVYSIQYLLSFVYRDTSPVLYLICLPIGWVIGEIFTRILVKFNPNIEVYPSGYNSTSNNVFRIITSSIVFIIPLIISILLWLFPLPPHFKL